MPTHQTNYSRKDTMFAPGFGTIFVQYDLSNRDVLKTLDGKCPGLEKTLFDTELPLLPPTAHHTHKAAYYAPLVHMPAYE